METKLVATGVEYELKECAIVSFIIPPLKLEDGTYIKLQDAEAVFEPIRMLIHRKGQDPLKARFHITQGRWEILDG